MIEQINNLAQLWWDWTLGMFWQVGLLIVLVALLDRLIRRWAWPQLQYALWLLILVKLVLSPSLSLPSGMLPKLRPFVAQALEKATSEPEVAQELSPVLPFFNDRIAQVTAQPEPHLLLAVEDIAVTSDSTGSERPPQVACSQLDRKAYAMTVWLLGMLSLGNWLIVKLRRLSREHPDKTGRASLPQSFYDQLANCAQRLGLRRRPIPVVTSSIRTPAVFGLFRPVLLMPAGYIRTLSRKDTEYLLLHELAHVKRGDLIVHSLYMLLQLVYWYNPLLWLVRRRLRHLRELCCDATVAGLLRNRTLEYRRTLLEAARQFLVTPVEYGLGLVGLFEDSNCLISRINCLEKPIWRYQKMKKLVAVTLALILLACVLPMTQAQQESASESSNAGPGLREDNPAEGVEESQAEQAQSQKLEQLQKAMQALQAQLQQLELQKQKLEHEMHAISHAEHQAHQAHQVGEHTAHAKIRAQTEHLQQVQQWANAYEKWAESDEFKQWQKDVQQWAHNLAKFQTSVLSGSGDPAPKPGPMPVMPTMPPMPANAVAPVLPVIGAPEVAPPSGLPARRSTGTSTSTAPTLPGETASTGKSARDVEVKKDKDGKYVATRQMQFVSKVKAGAPLVIRNNIGRIIVRPSKDGKCDVRAVIRGKAKTSNEARAKVEQVGMTVNSSEERYYLKPITRDGGEWDDLNVDLFVTVPPGIEPDLETRMGRVELYDFEGKIKTVTNMGAIKAVNTTGDLELFTKMGSIEFIAPKDLSAKFNIQTKMGSIKSDLPLEIDQSDMFRKGAKGTVGAGQGNIRMNTDMGSISLKWHSTPPDSPVF